MAESSDVTTIYFPLNVTSLVQHKKQNSNENKKKSHRKDLMGFKNPLYFPSSNNERCCL
jgi:hypothetical protein